MGITFPIIAFILIVIGILIIYAIIDRLSTYYSYKRYIFRKDEETERYTVDDMLRLKKRGHDDAT